MKKKLIKAGVTVAVLLASFNYLQANYRIATARIERGMAKTRDGHLWTSEDFKKFEEGDKVIIIFGRGETLYRDEIKFIW